MERIRVSDQELRDMADDVAFHHIKERDPFANPFRRNSVHWSIWDEGYRSGQYASNPYTENGFLSEVWVSGHRSFWWTPLDKEFP